MMDRWLTIEDMLLDFIVGSYRAWRIAGRREEPSLSTVVLRDYLVDRTPRTWLPWGRGQSTLVVKSALERLERRGFIERSTGMSPDRPGREATLWNPTPEGYERARSLGLGE